MEGLSGAGYVDEDPMCGGGSVLDVFVYADCRICVGFLLIDFRVICILWETEWFVGDLFDIYLRKCGVYLFILLRNGCILNRNIYDIDQKV